MPEATRRLYAHTLAGHAEEHWEPLDVHLAEVAELAESFSSAFASPGWGHTLGLCHDLGKGSDAFQAKLHAANPQDAEDAGVENAPAATQRVDHSTFGARYVRQYFPSAIGEMLAYCIAGHHAGLPNGRADDAASSRSALEARLDENLVSLPHVSDPRLVLPALSMRLHSTSAEDRAFSLAFFTRMLFSCLVDADRLCTERFCAAEEAKERTIVRPSIAALGATLRGHLEEKTASAPSTTVNLQRALILQQCMIAAEAAPGFFSLQVPTGGGKTLSSLAFALTHAARHGLRRVVVGIPFTSIIEQTADVYRLALGSLAENALVEHHTSVSPARDTRANSLAAENWDAPLVVTTNVQLFESLFAAATTPCRKLHRLAGSVIILDEAQTLPVDLLAPTLRALRELVQQYGCSVVLCTATQPALERRDDFLQGIEGVRPITTDPRPLFESLRRVEVVRLPGRQSLDELAGRIVVEHAALAIVNTKSEAAQLFSAVRLRSDDVPCFHLSTLMCADHRREVLQRIRAALKTGRCRVISTQLVEAGVDLDFPVVYRAEAGFDSIAQAAGRCNREGRLPGLGLTYVFESEHRPPPGSLRQAAETAQELWGRHPDPLAPQAIDAYFRLYYWRSSDVLDKQNVLACTALDPKRGQTRFQFRDVESRYKIIRNQERPVLIPFGKADEKYFAELQSPHVPFVSQRLLQPFLVSIPEQAFNALTRDGVIQEHSSGVGLLLRRDAYCPERGLRLEGLQLDPALRNV